jgi:hypothetical protein
MARITANRTPASAPAGQGQRAAAPPPLPKENKKYAPLVEHFEPLGGIDSNMATLQGMAGQAPKNRSFGLVRINSGSMTLKRPPKEENAENILARENARKEQQIIEMDRNLMARDYLAEVEAYNADAAKPRIGRGKPKGPAVESTATINRRRGGPETILTQGLPFADNQPKQKVKTLLGA